MEDDLKFMSAMVSTTPEVTAREFLSRLASMPRVMLRYSIEKLDRAVAERYRAMKPRSRA
jgi:hypothetical protein